MKTQTTQNESEWNINILITNEMCMLAISKKIKESVGLSGLTGEH